MARSRMLKLTILGYFLCFILIQFTNAADTSNKSYIRVIYYDIKPYIFTNDWGEIDGIYPMIMEQAKTHCLQNTTRLFIEYVHKYENREKFRMALRGNRSIHDKFKSHTWFPLMFNNITIDLMTKKENRQLFRVFNIVTVKKLAVVVARDNISLITKVAKGLHTCTLIFFIAFQMAVFFGILLWLLERNSDGGFPKGYISGVVTGLWWSFSLGYNDIVPKTFLGRLVATAWVATIVLVVSIMTASITNSVTEGVEFTISGNKVAFLEDSWEQSMVQRDYTVTPVKAKSYEDLFDLLRSGKAFAGVIDENVAAWYKDIILNDDLENPLRIVDTVTVNTFVDELVPKNVPDKLEDIFACMLENKLDVYERPLNTFYRSLPIETLYLDHVEYLVKNNRFIQGLLITVCVFLLVGFILAVYRRHQRIHKSMQEAVQAVKNRGIRSNNENEITEAKKVNETTALSDEATTNI